MIYCVIPRELEAELFDKMVEYYKDNPNVTVIVDRREGHDRRDGKANRRQGKRNIRDRRRGAATGTFPGPSTRPAVRQQRWSAGPCAPGSIALCSAGRHTRSPTRADRLRAARNACLVLVDSN